MTKFELLQSAIIARHSAEIENHSGKETTDAKNALSRINKANPEAVEKGLTKICNWTHQTPEELTSYFTLTDKKSAHFVNIKSVLKFIDLCVFLGSKVNTMDKYLNAVFTVALQKLIRGQVGINKNGVVGASMSQLAIKESLSYRAGLDNDRIDYLISIGRPDFLDSTYVTQSSQIKTMLISVGLCEGLKYKTSEVQFNGGFIRELNFLKDHLRTDLNSNGYNGAYAL